MSQSTGNNFASKPYLHRFIILLFLASSILLLAACTSNLQSSTPVPTITRTPAASSSPTPTNTPEPSPIPATATPALPLVVYYFVPLGQESPPAGSVVILPDILVLAPSLSAATRSPDAATNIASALQIILADPRNAWTSDAVSIASIAFREGVAHVALEGEYFGAGDVVLIAAREQILLTVFAEASVQTATVTLNGKNIANLGISHSSQVSPDDYAYTRLELETFMAENAYAAPLTDLGNLPTLSLQGIWQQNRSMAAGWADRYHFYPSGTFHYYPNEMICIEEKVEKIGTWEVQDTILTLTTTKQVINILEILPGGLCRVIEKTEITLAEPQVERLTVVDLGVQEGDIYPSILLADDLGLQDLQFWKFSDDASSYGDEK